MAFRSSTVSAVQNYQVTGTAPAGLTNDDWMIAFIVSDGLPTMSTVPSGWSLLDSVQTTADNNATFIYHKIAASEGSSWVWELSGTFDHTIIVGAWSGRNTAGSLTSTETNNNSSNTSPISCGLSGVTAASGDDIAWFCGLDQLAGGDVWGFAAPTNYTEAQDGGIGWVRASLAYRDNVSSGATGTVTGTATRTSGSSNSGFAGYVVALPASGGGATTRGGPFDRGNVFDGRTFTGPIA